MNREFTGRRMLRMKIDDIKLQNFKCHRNFEIPLKNLNILTGSNAAGKSSLIQGLLLAKNAWKEYEKKRIGPHWKKEKNSNRK